MCLLIDDKRLSYIALTDKNREDSKEAVERLQQVVIILVNSKPTDITNLVEFGRATYRKMIQNLFWATGYNVVAIPLAAGVLYPDFVLSPALGAVLMSASTVIVALNAQLLKRSLRNTTP